MKKKIAFTQPQSLSIALVKLNGITGGVKWSAKPPTLFTLTQQAKPKS